MKFKIYKKGQGKNTRLYTALGLAIAAALGCFTLYGKLNAVDFTSLNDNTEQWVVTLVPVVLFLILGWLIFWLINKPKIADFMVDAEGEMKKVSWSTRKEIAVSTGVVIIVVVLMATFIGLVDIGFQLLFSEVIGI